MVVSQKVLNIQQIETLQVQQSGMHFGMICSQVRLSMVDVSVSNRIDHWVVYNTTPTSVSHYFKISVLRKLKCHQ